MTTEVWLFIIVGVISVVAAFMMLISENAVHSALFLILNMGCIAFFFLMLNAPFLAMVQITVYAGAIMVLFLFVIMLLGAERLTGRSPFRWLTPVAMVLALVFLVIAYVVLNAQPISEFAPPAGNPQVRVAQFASDAGAVDLRVSGVVVDEDLEFGDTVGYLTFPPGDYEFALVTTGTNDVVAAQSVTLEAGFIGTVIAYGSGTDVAFGVVADDLAPTEERSGRLTVFNAYGELPAVSLVDLGNEFDAEDTTTLIGDLAPGSESTPVEFEADTELRTWALIEAGNENNVLARLDNDEVFGIERGVATLLIVGADRRLDSFTIPIVTPLAAAAVPTFGSPIDVGQLLFSRYMLPMQAVAILLLVAMVGAIVLTHRKQESPALARARLGRRRVSRPLTSVIAAQVGREVTQTNAEQLTLPTDEPAAGD